MADREDDLKIGVKSTAILFGRYDVIIISILQMLFLLMMGAAMWHYFAPTTLGVTPVFGLALVAMMFAKQNSVCASRNAQACFQAFLANIWVGRYVFALVAIACIWTTLNG
jgi:4-hydroxybenzoate polyprenyltransferase